MKKIWTKCGRFIVSLLTFLIITMPFRQLFSVMSVTEVRPASALPPVFGILFGIPGALGTAVGNMIADVISGYSPTICIVGFLVQFMYGYIPYKMWHSFPFYTGNKMEPPRLSSTRRVVKYIIIVVVDSVIMAGFLGFLMAWAGITEFMSIATLMLFLNNVVFCMIIGIPIIIMISLSRISIQLPPERKSRRMPAIIFDICFVGGVAVIIGYCVCILSGKMLSIEPFLVATFVLLATYACKTPVGKFSKKETIHHMTLNEKLILVFLMLGGLTAVLIGFVAYVEMPVEHVDNLVAKWNRIYIYIAVDLSIFYFISVLFLWYAEKKITLPIEILADVAKNYVTENKESEGNNHIIEQCNQFANNQNEVGYLAISFREMTEELNHYMNDIKQMTMDKERVAVELNIAKQIQIDMLPSHFPAFPQRTELDIYAKIQSVPDGGGDFYDFFFVDKKRVCVVIGNVQGSGIPATLMAVVSKTHIKNYAQLGYSPSRIMAETNNQLSYHNKIGMTVGVFLGIIDLDSGMMDYVNAGQIEPLWKHSGLDFQFVEGKKCLPLASMENVPYWQMSVQLVQGDLLFMHTKGVSEAIDAKGNLYSKEYLVEFMDILVKQEFVLENILHSLEEDQQRFQGGTKQNSDSTMLIFRFFG